MIKEGERAIRKTEEWIKGSLGVFGERLVELFEMTPLARMLPMVGGVMTPEAVPVLSTSVLTSALPSVYKIGPVPAELRVEPFVGDSTPWSIQEAQKEHDRVRKQQICLAIAAVSWAVTVVSVLRSVGFL